MLDKILAFIADKFTEAPIVVTKGNVNMPANGWTELATISLKAKRRYLLIGKAGTGNSAQATSNASIILKSGTANVFLEMSQGSFTSASGHSVGTFAYIETKTACTVTIRKYNYTSTAYPGGNAMMVAIPVLSGGGVL